jgi:hypothetical protein
MLIYLNRNCIIICLLSAVISLCIMNKSLAQNNEKVFITKRSSYRSRLNQEKPKTEGNHYLAITVYDKNTGSPIPQYIVHASIIRLETVTIEDEEIDRTISIGTLESKKVDNKDGICIYENLPEGDFKFSIKSEDYVPYKLILNIPETGEITSVEMTRGARIKGRLVDAVSGMPISNMDINLIYDKEDHWPGQVDSDETDMNGEFKFSGFAPRDYKLKFPDIKNSISSWQEDLKNIPRRTQSQKTEEFISNYQKIKKSALEKTYYINPRIEDIKVEEGGSIDIGCISLQRIPVLELEIIDEKGEAIPYFPFELNMPEKQGYGRTYKEKTDVSGKHKVPLIGFSEGMKAEIFIPERMRSLYQVKMPGQKENAPLADFNETKERKLINALYESNEQIVIEDKLVNFAELSQEEKEAAISREIKEIKEVKLRIAALPVHPNAKILYPKAGEHLHVKIIYHPTETDMNLSFLIRDKITKEPIQEFDGRISTKRDFTFMFLHQITNNMSFLYNQQSSDTVYFKSVNRSGRITIDSFPLDESFIKDMEHLKNNPPDIRYRNNFLKLYVGIAAPGYVRQVFEIPIEKSQGENELIFEIEAESIATGRIVFAETGEPFTTDTLKTLLIQSGQINPYADKKEKRFRRKNYYNIKVVMQNNLVEGDFDPARTPHFRETAYSNVNDKGIFKIQNLRPCDGWVLKIETTGLPTYVEKDIMLNPGLNDLGDISIGLAGNFEGFIKDEKNNPVCGAAIQFPLEDNIRNSNQKMETDATGAYSFNMKDLSLNRQIVRIVPQWGYKKSRSGYIEETNLWFDSIKKINKFQRVEFNPIIHRGNNLRVEIPCTTATLEMAEFYSKHENYPYEFRYPDQHTYYFGIRNINLLSKKPTNDGFIYHHKYVIPNAENRLTTQTLVFNIPNVPPGPLAILVNGTIFSMRKHYSQEEKKPTENGGIPILFSEFEMPASTHTLSLEPNCYDVDVSLSFPSKKKLPKNLDNIIFTFERTSPVSTGLGGDIQRIMKNIKSIGGRSPESFITPFIGFTESFIKFDRERKEIYKPAAFKLVPEGKYKLQAYSNIFDMMGVTPKPYYEYEITVPKGKGKIKITIPYNAGSSQTDTEPLSGKLKKEILK